MPTEPTISAIVPARNEEPVIAGCVRSIARQPEVLEILVVNDQSTDRTAEIVRNLIPEIPHLRLLETSDLPAGWVGKITPSGSARSKQKGSGFSLLMPTPFSPNAPQRKLFNSRKKFRRPRFISPEQSLKTWYEKTLIPFVFCRLARKFSYADVNNPNSPAAAANGQFL